MTRKTPLQRLDDLVRWTGIPQLSQQPPRRRPLRWPATLALVLAFGGVAIMAANGFAGHGYGLGYAMLMIGFTTGLFVNIFGPLKPPLSTIERIDEWDRAARSRAYLFTFGLFVVATLVGLTGVLAMVLLGPVEAAARAVGALLFLLFAVYTATPTAYASWRWRWDDGR